MASKLHTITVEVAYASTQQQTVIPVTVTPGTTVLEAIKRSGITNQYPEIDLVQYPAGIFGRKVDYNHKVVAGDRIELYRPLTIDPKTARRLREAKKKAAR